MLLSLPFLGYLANKIIVKYYKVLGEQAQDWRMSNMRSSGNIFLRNELNDDSIRLGVEWEQGIVAFSLIIQAIEALVRKLNQNPNACAKAEKNHCIETRATRRPIVASKSCEKLIKWRSLTKCEISWNILE